MINPQSHSAHYFCHLGRVGFNVPPNTIFTGQMTQPTMSQHWRTMVGVRSMEHTWYS